MVQDYRESKVGKNLPRQGDGWRRQALLPLTVLMAFALGIAAGWVLFRHGEQQVGAGRGAKAESIVAQQPAASAIPTQPQGADGAGNKGKEPPMTFYYTLPKGEKPPLGSGINSPRREERGATKGPAPVAAAVTAKSTQQPRTAATGEASKAHPTKGRYCVQVASYQNRKEAELVKARLAANGFVAYIVESTLPGKGVRFRVRIGRSLDFPTATGLAAKAGKGAMVAPE